MNENDENEFMRTNKMKDIQEFDMPGVEDIYKIPFSIPDLHFLLDAVPSSEWTTRFNLFFQVTIWNWNWFQ